MHILITFFTFLVLSSLIKFNKHNEGYYYILYSKYLFKIIWECRDVFTNYRSFFLKIQF